VKSNKTSLTVRAVLMCLTICQFSISEAQQPLAQKPIDGQAQTQAKKQKLKGRRLRSSAVAADSTKSQVIDDQAIPAQQAKARPPARMRPLVQPTQRLQPTQKVAAVEDMRQQPEDDISGEIAPIRSSARTKISYSETWLTENESLLMPVPKAHMFIANASASGVSSTTKASVNSFGINISAKNTSTAYGPDIGLMYGLTDNLYFGASYSYRPGHSETEVSSPGYTTSKSTNNSDGWSEPSVQVGASAEITSGMRVIGEVSGTVPVGNAQSVTTGNDTKDNGLSGGGSVTPKIAAISSLGSVKLIGSVGYTFALDRKTDSVTNTLPSSTTTSGGNSVIAAAAVELPSVYNLGLGATYISTDALTSKSTATFTGATTKQEDSVQRASAITYMGIPISAINSILVPSLSYSTLLNNQRVDTVTITNADVWTFGLAGIVHF
jgi:hypothetical protein